MNYNWLEYTQWAVNVFTAGGLIGTWFGIRKFSKIVAQQLDELTEVYNAACGLIEAEAERKESHTRAFEVLSNPELIAEEMERSSEATESRIARRTTLPREDGIRSLPAVPAPCRPHWDRLSASPCRRRRGPSERRRLRTCLPGREYGPDI